MDGAMTDRLAHSEAALRSAAVVIGRVTSGRADAELRYDMMSDAVYWSDEPPAIDSHEAIEAVWALRPVFHHRVCVMLARPSPYAHLWELARDLFPMWIGFAHDRCHLAPDVLAHIAAMMQRGEREIRKLVRWADRAPDPKPPP